MSTFITCIALAALCGSSSGVGMFFDRPEVSPPRPLALSAVEAKIPQVRVPTTQALASEAPAERAEAESPEDSAEQSTGQSTGGNVTPEARPLVERVQSFYENTEDFTAGFSQTYTYEVGRQVRSRGTVSFKRPAMMRWDYEHPRERSFIVDGTDLWIWTPEDYSVVRQRGFTASDLSTSITFLWGEGRLEDEFHIALADEDTLSLTPIRPDGAFQSVVFKVDPESGRVIESTVVDPQGNRNHMLFSDMRLNAGVGKERFEFSPPEGADLQEMPDMRR